VLLASSSAACCDRNARGRASPASCRVVRRVHRGEAPSCCSLPASLSLNAIALARRQDDVMGLLARDISNVAQKVRPSARVFGARAC
jgi:hypothetical protein